MSILDALRIQKANQKSIMDLAALPQDEIIRLAQMGHIPADVVPVVINEKARMAASNANMEAAAKAQRGLPTVIEQAMQTNAQAESGAQMPPQMPAQVPAQMPPQMPQTPPQAGVAGLPTGQMFQPQNFQTGGIVAFAGGGLYDDIDEDTVAADAGETVEFVPPPVRAGLAAIPQSGKRPGSLAEAIAQYKEMSAAARKESPEEIALREARTKGSLSSQDIEQQKYMRLLQAGLGILGGESPYAFTNIGKGSQEALKGYAEDVRTQQAQKLQDLKEAADLARAKRLEEIQDIQGGAALYEKQLDREQRAELAKENQLGAKYADNYVAMMRAKGDKRPEEIIRDEGYRTFFREYGYAASRVATQAATAVAGQQVTSTGQIQEARQRAVDAWNKLKEYSKEKLKYAKLLTTDPEAAERLKEDFIQEQIKTVRPEAAQKPVRPGAGKPESSAESQPSQGRYRIGETRVVASGQHKGKTAVWDGTGWKLKE